LRRSQGSGCSGTGYATYLGPFEAAAEKLDRPWALAVAWRLRGVLAATAGKQEVAYDAFERALLHLERVRMPLERARTLLLAGQVYRRYKNRSKARQALSEALALFEAVGAPLGAASARAELARVGRPARRADVLTETERMARWRWATANSQTWLFIVWSSAVV